MRLVIQRVTSASVSIDGEIVGKIAGGLMVLVGVREGDTEADMKWLAQKTVNMRIFDDENGVMNRSVIDAGGEVLSISQFSYIHAAGHDLAVPLYEAYCEEVSRLMGKDVQRGKFGADMQVSLVNDGPVTIIIDSLLKE